MTTLRKGELELQLDRKRIMRMDYNAIAEAEEALNKPFPSVNLRNMSIKELRGILYGTLKEDDLSLTVQDVGRLMTDYGDTLIGGLVKVVAAAFPSGGEGESPQGGRKKGKE